MKNMVDYYEISDSNVIIIVDVLDSISGDDELTMSKIENVHKIFVDLSVIDDFLTKKIKSIKYC